MVTPFNQNAAAIVHQLAKQRKNLPTVRVRIFCKETNQAQFNLEMIVTDIAGRRLPFRCIPEGSSLLNQPLSYPFPITSGTKPNRRYRIPRGALKLCVPTQKQIKALGVDPELVLK